MVVLVSLQNCGNHFCCKWQNESLRRVLCGDSLYGVVQAKVVSLYVEGLGDASMSRGFAEAMKPPYKVDSTGRTETSSLVDQRALVRKIKTV